MTSLPRDNDNNTIQALRLHPAGAHRINATASSARNSIPFNEDTRIVSIYATGPLYIKFGEENVTANTNDHYYPSGIYYDFAIGNATRKIIHEIIPSFIHHSFINSLIHS